jgi:hypothetical protein
MTTQNPGSLKAFEVAHPEIPSDEIIIRYTGALASFRSGVVDLENAPLSTDFLLIQGENQEKGAKAA